MSVNAVSSSIARMSRARRLSLTLRGSVARFGDQDLLKGLELLDALAGAHRHRVKRVVGDVNRHPGLVLQPPVETAKQSAAAGEHDAAIHDVTGQLRGRLVECRLD